MKINNNKIASFSIYRYALLTVVAVTCLMFISIVLIMRQKRQTPLNHVSYSITQQKLSRAIT